MNQLDTFTSTGKKLLRHGHLLMYWKSHDPVPQSLQVAPTEKCQLRCKFCSVVNRKKTYELPILDLISATRNFIELGTKTVEITGGGEPLCYPEIIDYLSFLVQNEIHIGLITNGIEIDKIPEGLLNKIDWIRISANVYDYTKKIAIPKGYRGTLGFSYVWTDGLSSLEVLETIKKIALDNGVKYIRLVPNCIATKEEQERNNNFLEKIALQVGPPLFFQRKEFNTPPKCFWGFLKPFLYADGYIYPCSSTVLNPDADKQFHSSYRLCHWTEINSLWKGEQTNPYIPREIPSLVDTTRCEHCVFGDQNRMLEYILEEQEHEQFI